jgi:hypothetical protein
MSWSCSSDFLYAQTLLLTVPLCWNSSHAQVSQIKKLFSGRPERNTTDTNKLCVMYKIIEQEAFNAYYAPIISMLIIQCLFL